MTAIFVASCYSCRSDDPVRINLTIANRYAGRIVLKDSDSRSYPRIREMDIDVNEEGVGNHPGMDALLHRSFQFGTVRFSDGTLVKVDILRKFPKEVALREGYSHKDTLYYFVGTEEEWKMWITSSPSSL